MDGVPCHWSNTRATECFSRCRPATGTLSRLAKLVAQAEHKQTDCQTPDEHLACHSCGPQRGQEVPDMTEHVLHQELKHVLPKREKDFSLLSTLQLHRCDTSPNELDSACVGGATHADKSPGHQPSLIGGIPYACAPCGRGFGQKQALLQHQRTGCSEPSPGVAGDGAGIPPADSPRSVSKAGSSNSYSSEVKRSVYKCPFCPKVVRSGAGLHCHMRKSHEAEMSVVRRSRVRPTPGKSPQLLSCRSCEMVFKSTAKLYLHRKETHTREKAMRRENIPVLPSKRRKHETYICQACGQVFLHHLSFRAHSKKHSVTTVQKQGRTGESDARDSKFPVGPKKCGRKMERLDKETRKRRKAEEEGEFPCPSCAKVFSLQSELTNHVELHQSSAHWTQCRVCLQEMDTSKGSGSKKHRLYHCVPCRRTFPALDTFLEHCQDHLRVRVEEDGVAEAYGFHSNKN
ncbi:hypothetical protein NHX12_012774 [Muraenolepis orangiensis]|uniref:C2H2-type domain-containing protein n=1 Tax=Muraenolepis orangiensis TaxID=630683 RepID=A0A9Q0I7F0_9TELE|nr:hypothetical protein NHX12_012774 [Muraenolepis orangiensis]